MIKKAYSTTKWAEKSAYRKANKRAIDRAFDIALRVMDLLETKGWRAADLAREMGVTPQYISRIVKGQELNLGNDVLDKLADALDAPIMEVVKNAPKSDLNRLHSVVVELVRVGIEFSNCRRFEYTSKSLKQDLGQITLANRSVKGAKQYSSFCSKNSFYA